ncbi:hypothetical protein V8E51_019389 [Hyaloscypha variabilis]
MFSLPAADPWPADRCCQARLKMFRHREPFVRLAVLKARPPDSTVRDGEHARQSRDFRRQHATFRSSHAQHNGFLTCQFGGGICSSTAHEETICRIVWSEAQGQCPMPTSEGVRHRVCQRPSALPLSDWLTAAEATPRPGRPCPRATANACAHANVNVNINLTTAARHDLYLTSSNSLLQITVTSTQASNAGLGPRRRTTSDELGCKRAKEYISTSGVGT